MTAYLRRILPYLTAAAVLALAYDAWVFYSRWDRARQAEQQRAQKEAEDAQRILKQIGGTDLKILGFYADPSVIAAGQKARLCYSVVNAKRVRIEPAVKELYPALSYCWDVSPRRRTEYRLIAEDGAGHRVNATTGIDVQR